MTEMTAEYDVDMVSVAVESSPSWEHEVDELARLLHGRRFAMLTGAGISTDSGIPDYRGQGSSRRTPMSIDQFRSDTHYRKRYWAGSHRGWFTFASALPNDGHRAVAALEQSQLVTGVVTQNVDGLHRRAGSAHVVDLHGSLDRVVCLECGQRYDRSALALRLSRENPWLDDQREVALAPDGDADVESTDFDSLVIPECEVCGGMLKPDVVFFGEVVPFRIYQAATNIVRKSEALVVAGSSLMVNSGFRLVDQARRARMPVVIINRGTTKADGVADIRIDAGTSEVLLALASRLGAADLAEDIE
jgi:NAD-dependent SIR2 family protein deacetylase